ncbi:MAG TPA: Stf0 family sulfotransferase [Rubrobacteraceae bacterium]|nr:Stf0 family sulfotransferase [Rubrobacteraceae bacterium]
MQPGRPELSYLICATPRSGSTFLCAALEGTGIAGRPAEHFEVLLETGRPRQPRDYFQRSNDPEVWALLDDPEFQGVLGDYGGRFAERPTRRDLDWRPPDFPRLLESALERGTTPNGVFATKIMWAYFRDFVRLARRTGREGVAPCEVPASVFPNLRRYVWIRRQDTVRQAVSLWKALQTQQWRQDSDNESEGGGLRFNYPAVAHLKLRIDEHNAAWRGFFDSCKTEPVEIVYEELAEDYEANVTRILEETGIPVPDGFVLDRPGIKRQSDAISEEWVRMYHEGQREASRAPVRSGRG